MIFPIVGKASFTDDFASPRADGPHGAIDVLGARRAPVVAAEAGTVKIWTASASAGCMLYLYAERTTYLYVHLNNDVGPGNDNAGRCTQGVAYAPGLKSGQKVRAGQLIGYVGDSGNANGGPTHVHFEMHTRSDQHLNPYRYLRRASRLLFPSRPGKPFTAALRGKVLGAVDGALTLKSEQVRVWPGGAKLATDGRSVRLAVPPATVVLDPLGALLATARLQTLAPGRGAVAWTLKADATLRAALGRPLALVTERVVLSPAPSGR